MKRLFYILVLMLGMTFTMNSCTDAQYISTDIYVDYEYDYYYDGIYYPMKYIGTVPYYYYNFSWVIIPRYDAHYMRHFDRPRRYYHRDHQEVYRRMERSPRPGEFRTPYRYIPEKRQTPVWQQPQRQQMPQRQQPQTRQHPQRQQQPMQRGGQQSGPRSGRR